MTPFLRSYALLICLGFAVAVTCLLAPYLVSEDAMPCGDGVYYVSRAFALYGYLHSGQWDEFWNLFTSPRQCLAPLHYWIFFIVPKAWAGVAAYMAIQLLSTYLLLAVAIWKICQNLKRPDWAPAIFLLCAIQNFALNYPYSFLVDMPFFALGTLALAWQMQAWYSHKFYHSVLSGLGVALLFWAKPPNALVFFGTYFLAEFAYMSIKLKNVQSRENFKRILIVLIDHAKGILLGFIPITLIALICGAGQSILLLIEGNEVNDIPMELKCNGLLRLFYFPLCLTYFYHVAALVIIFGTIIGFSLWIQRKRSLIIIEQFPVVLFIPIVFAYLTLGEIFSFVMLVKTMRSMLLILPILWITVFWCMEKMRVQSKWFSFAVLIYGVTVFSQIFFNNFGSILPIAEDYQINNTWAANMPENWSAFNIGPKLNNEVCGSIREFLPHGGKVSVNVETMYFDGGGLYWGLERKRLLNGERPLYHANTFFDWSGKFYYQGALVNSNLLVLITYPYFQMNQVNQQSTLNLISYGINQWRMHDKLAKTALLPFDPKAPLGYELIFDKPLTETQMKVAMNAISCIEVDPGDPDDYTNNIYGRHYSWTETWHLLYIWGKKRFG